MVAMPAALKDSEGTQSQPADGKLDQNAPKDDKQRVVNDDKGGAVAANGSGK